MFKLPGLNLGPRKIISPGRGSSTVLLRESGLCAEPWLQGRSPRSAQAGQGVSVTLGVTSHLRDLRLHLGRHVPHHFAEPTVSGRRGTVVREDNHRRRCFSKHTRYEIDYNVVMDFFYYHY